MKKQYCFVLAMFMLLCGCSKTQPDKEAVSNKNEESSTIRNEFKQLDMELLKQKIENKNTFVFMVSQSTCSYCNSLKRTLVPYLREHTDLDFYELEIDMLGTKKSEINTNFSKLQELIPEYSGSTPELFYIDNGALRKQTSGDMDEVDLHNFFVDCGLVDEEKKQKEVIDVKIKESSYLEVSDFLKIDKKINDKEDFYLYLAESDRYNAMFSETLAKYLDMKQLKVWILKLDEQQQPSSQEDYNDMVKASERLGTVLVGYQYTPAVFHIKDGKVFDFIMDNVSEKELSNWLEKQS